MDSVLPRVAVRTTYSPPRIALYAVAATAAWILSVSIGAVLRVDPGVEKIALVAHTISLVAAFGAVLLVDWVGFLWLISRRRLHETSRIESAALPIIWGGLAGLLVTGALINPDMQSPLTIAKVSAVLVLMLNGILLIPCMRRLNSMPAGTTFGDVPPAMRVHLLICLAISQGCWWTAMVVGFINSSDLF
jgi:hypothetical protein